MHKDTTGRYQSGFLGDYYSFDPFIAQHTLSPYPSGKGILFFQHLDRVEPIYDVGKAIHFEEIKGIHSQPMHKLVAQVYDFQKYIYRRNVIKAENPELLMQRKEFDKLLFKFNDKMLNHYRRMGKTLHHKHNCGIE